MASDQSTTRRRLLAVDDDEAYLDALRDELETAGFAVVPARSGELALELLPRAAIDLVLLDLSMPGISGHETCRRIKDQPALRTLPVVFLTAREDREALVAGLEAGADDFIAKTSPFEVLVSRIRAQLRRREFEEENQRFREELVRREAQTAHAADLERKNEELVAARDALLRAQRQKDDLSALLVHDLKNPLAGILAHGQFLSTQALPADAGDSVHAIVRATEALINMVMNLLDIARSEDGTLVAEKETVELGEIVDDVRGILGARADERRQRLIIAPGLRGHTVLADRGLLQRVLENLLDNSLKYSPAGSEIRIEAAALDGLVELRVRDPGMGIPADLRQAIFDKYFRVDVEGGGQARTSRGLGLVFCRMAIEAHGGRIWVEDNQPRGTCFCVTLRSAGETTTNPDAIPL